MTNCDRCGSNWIKKHAKSIHKPVSDEWVYLCVHCGHTK